MTSLIDDAIVVVVLSLVVREMTIRVVFIGPFNPNVLINAASICDVSQNDAMGEVIYCRQAMDLFGVPSRLAVSYFLIIKSFFVYFT